VLEALDRDTRCQLLALYECKGTLSVNWRQQPTAIAFAALVDAWHEHGEIISNHFVNGEELILDAPGYANPFSS
jgi:hypothetical protein